MAWSAVWREPSASGGGLDRDVTRGDLLLPVIERLQVLAQDEDVLGTVITREGRDDLGLGGVAPIVAAGWSRSPNQTPCSRRTTCPKTCSTRASLRARRPTSSRWESASREAAAGRVEDRTRDDPPRPPGSPERPRRGRARARHLAQRPLPETPAPRPLDASGRPRPVADVTR